jgi:RecA/RadA recombinase
MADGDRLTLGDVALDRLFGGGLELDGSLTEIVGERSVLVTLRTCCESSD